MSGEEHLKRELVHISRRCGKLGWCPGSSGNISVLDPNCEKAYIKASGADMTELEVKDVVTIDLGGRLLEGSGSPSKEFGLHLGIYKMRNDVKGVLHVHAPFATAFAVAGKKIPMVTETSRIVLGDVQLVDLASPGSSKLAKDVIEVFEDPNAKAVLLKEHGMVTVGQNLSEAFRIAELVEDTARIALLSSFLGAS